MFILYGKICYSPTKGIVLRLKRKFGFRKRDLHLGREDDIIF